jgi:Flp pilus assembly pilin Flp
MKRRMLSLMLNNESAQTLVESSLIYFLIAITVLISLRIFGATLQEYYFNAADKIIEIAK